MPESSGIDKVQGPRGLKPLLLPLAAAAVVLIALGAVLLFAL